jgi:exodeoxyribonuclease VII small subunit
MEAGQMPLEQSLAAYKRGAELLKFCQAALQDAQQQVKILEENVLKNFGATEQ